MYSADETHRFVSGVSSHHEGEVLTEPNSRRGSAKVNGSGAHARHGTAKVRRMVMVMVIRFWMDSRCYRARILSAVLCSYHAQLLLVEASVVWIRFRIR